MFVTSSHSNRGYFFDEVWYGGRWLPSLNHRLHFIHQKTRGLASMSIILVESIVAHSFLDDRERYIDDDRDFHRLITETNTYMKCRIYCRLSNLTFRVWFYIFFFLLLIVSTVPKADHPSARPQSWLNKMKWNMP